MPAAPSLLIVPYRSKTGKLYSQIPTSGAGDFTVTRNTTATRFNSAGLLESVASGIPRLDYYTSGGTAGCPALLVEPAATNLAPNANLMNVLDTPTVSGGVTFTTGSTDFLAPDGTSGSINKYVGGAASGVTQNTRYGGTTIQASASGVHTFSLFVKRGATNPLDFCALGFGLFGSSSGTMTSYFNLASGTAITAGASIQNYGNGWYRLISAPVTLASTDLSGTVSFNLAPSSGSLSFATSGALNLTAYTWGAQFEAGSVATSYIPTTTAAVTRNADVILVSGAVSGSIGQTEGTMYAEVDVRLLSTVRSFLSLTLNSNSTDFINFQINTSNQFFTRIRNKTGSVVDVVASGVTTTAGIHKLACSYSSGDITFALDGVIIGTNTNANTDFTAALNCVLLGAGPAATSGGIQSGFLNDRIRAVALYTTRLTNAELAALTSP